MNKQKYMYTKILQLKKKKNEKESDWLYMEDNNYTRCWWLIFEK